MNPFDTLAAEQLLSGARLLGPVFRRETTASTNDEVRELGLAGAGEGTVVVAEAQTAGRGRQGRGWHGASGACLMFSVLLRPTVAVEEWAALGPLAGTAVAAAGTQLGGAPLGTKWPNDVVSGGRKLGGLLLEGRPPEFVVLGIGINVRGAEADFPPDLRATATTLEAVSGRQVGRETLLAGIVNELDRLYGWLLEGREAELLAEQKRRETVLGREVTMRSAGRILRGQAQDLTTRGELKLRTEAGEIVVATGEVQSVRGLDGELPV